MKKILVTQRVDELTSYKERRDAIDQRWTDLLISLDILPIFCSNNPQHLEMILSNQDIDGVILTGGGSLLKYGGDTPERDKIEKYILDWAIKTDTSVLGVCRGMQVIQDYFGISLININNHVGVRHKLNVRKSYRLSPLVDSFFDVNSYHNQGTNQNSSNLISVATSQDDIVMAVEHIDKNIFGVMWHCERENPFKSQDKNLIRFVFC
jgi:N5-(cytidine 5'-diphosphoramidyl)-L-glutamine hydrolase